MKIKEYLKNCTGIYHLTLDPKEESVIRIHLIPPKKLKMNIPWIVILNGYYLLPLQTGWAVLLKEFMEVVNNETGEFQSIDAYIVDACKNAKLIFKKATYTLLKQDLSEVIATFKAIVERRKVNTEIGLMTFKEYHKFMKAPHRMDLMISSMTKKGVFNCNQKCLHCYANGEKLSNVDELSTEKWYEIIDKLKEIGIPQLTFTGGEPTLRNDLVDLIKHAEWFITRLNTNGLLLTRELCQKLYTASLDSVQITFYSSDKNIHNLLVGGNHFDKCIEGIKNAIDAGLDVSCNTPLCSINQNYLDTIKFLQSLGVKYFSASGLILAGNAKADTSVNTNLSKNAITNIIKEAKKYCDENDLELSFTSPGLIEEDILNKLKMITPSCGACLSNMAIAPNGDVIPCQSWLFEAGLGNVLDTNWKDIWNHHDCIKRRKFSALSSQICPLRQVD